jgi:hypothetical protein
MKAKKIVLVRSRWTERKKRPDPYKELAGGIWSLRDLKEG